MDPCSVCGGTDVNLVDGFYYCVECGTQDVNVRETIVEQTAIGDGTFAHTTVRRFTTAIQDGIKMSSEWHKWHTFNFILAGLTDELIALGAKPSVKMKVLWIWSKYIKQYQVKDDSQSKVNLDFIADDDSKKNNSDDEKEDSGNDDAVSGSRKKSKKAKSDPCMHDIKIFTKGTLLTFLYIALNLDRSDIQLSHLFRFMREGRLNLFECIKYVPKDLNVNEIKNWKSFHLCHIDYNPVTIRELTMTCFKKLQLGVPLVPDLRKLVKNYIQELCLPDDFTDLVFALMHYVPLHFLYVDAIIQKSLVRIPDYEGVCMAYILVALKMCFGLDDDYEVKLSEEIDKINDEENYLKSYKLGLFTEGSDRLFSFKDWCQHLQFRKFMLCKNFLPISKQFNSEVDDYVFMEHLEKRKKRQIKLSDDVTMDILNKIKSEAHLQVIPKSDFPVTLTPMTTYVAVLAQNVQDPDLKLLLCEDFTQYSLRYAIKDLKLPFDSHCKEASLVGVSELGKTFNNHITGTLKLQEADMSMVYVRNCQNKNWLKTKPPKAKHVAKNGENENSVCQQPSDKESDHGYDSNIENSIHESDVTHFSINDESLCKEDQKIEIVKELDDNKSIFDDDFLDIAVTSSNHAHITLNEDVVDNGFVIDTQSNMEDSKAVSFPDNEIEEDMSLIQFNPITFNREEMIRELIELARKTYKIPAAKEKTPRAPRKRKLDLVNNEASSNEPKKKRTENRLKPGQAKVEIDKLVSAYYDNVKNDVINQISEQVKALIENVENRNDIDATNITQNQNDTLSGVIDSQILNADENRESQTRIDTNLNAAEITVDVISPCTVNEHSTIIEENMEEVEELFLKSDPNFDEKDHDVKQLYVKLREDLDTMYISVDDLNEDQEIDKIIQSQIHKFSSNDTSIIANNIIDNIHESSDSEDDVPLNVLKESADFEQEKKERKKEKLEPLLRDCRTVEKFNYWIRHYKSARIRKSRDIGKIFDMELHENLPISFVFVIRECAAIIGCSLFSLYKNFQNIEERLIAYSEC